MTYTLSEPWGLLGEFGDAEPECRASPLPTPPDTIGDAGARARRHQEREALLDEALHAARAAVRIIQSTVDAGGADLDDAIRALAPLHRVLEAYDRKEAAQNLGSTVAQAALTIVLDDTPQVPVGRNRRPPAEVIDV